MQKLTEINTGICFENSGPDVLPVKCGRAESIVKYRSGGLFFKKTKMQPTTEQDRKPIQKRDQNRRRKRLQKASRRQPKNHRKWNQNGGPELPGRLPESVRTRFLGSGSPSKKTLIFEAEKKVQKSILNRSGAIWDAQVSPRQ